MKNSIKLSFSACALALSLAGCSKHITPTKTIADAPQSNTAEEAQTSTPIDTLDITDLIVKPQDSVASNSVTIPQEEEEQYEPIIFSEEQSKSLILPEYKDMEVDDISLMLTEMQNGEFHYPTDSTSYVTSPYGWRGRRMHAGIDLKVYVGDDIYSAFDGVVRIAKYYGGYGYCVVVRHHNGLETLYGHCSKLLVEVNDVVKAGQVIALGGNTGRSTGSHLHFEVRVAGSYINPNLVIDTKNHGLQDKNLYITRRKNRIFASNNDSAEEREADIIEELSIRYHIVRSGDVLSRIAANNHTTVSTLCRLNHISSRSTLRIGQRLIVRDGIRPTTSATKQQAKVESKPASQTIARTATGATYTVRKGDTLSKIAQRNQTTVSSICALNNISSRTTLQIGQKLALSGSTTNSSATATPTNTYIYTVKSGDTLSQIAEKNHTTIRSLCQLNNITTRTTLQIGQKLRIAKAI